jgi:hypothetical protein
MIPGTKVHKIACSRGIEYPYSHAAVRQGGPDEVVYIDFERLKLVVQLLGQTAGSSVSSSESRTAGGASPENGTFSVQMVVFPN